MEFKMSPEFEQELANKLNRAYQAAVSATSRAHHEQGEEDVKGHLRRELEARGIQDVDDAWLEEQAGNIRDSQHTFVTSDEEVGRDDS